MKLYLLITFSKNECNYDLFTRQNEMKIFLITIIEMQTSLEPCKDE